MGRRDIPFLDLLAVQRELQGELGPVFKTALDTAGFIGGHTVQEFGREFAEFCESRFCVGVASGADALRFAPIAAGVQRGDTVVTVAAQLHRRRGGDLAGWRAGGFRGDR